MGTAQRGDQRSTAERRRKELLEAADRVVLRDGPGASMNAIAAEAGITKPILYRHFGDKEGLYRALAVRHTDALLSALRAALDAASDRRERVETTLDTYLAAIETRPQVYRFLMHSTETAPGAAPGTGQAGGPDAGGEAGPDAGGEAGPGTGSGFDSGAQTAPLLRRLGEELAKVIAERVELGPDGEQAARVWSHGIVGMMYAAGDWWLRERPCPRRELVRHLTDLLWGQLSVAGDKVGAPGF